MSVNKKNTWVGRSNLFLTFVALTSLAVAILAAPSVKKYARLQAEVELQVLKAQDADAHQVKWLALALYFEARGETKRAGLEGMKVVAEVILKRVEDPRWPDSIEAVVRQGEELSNRCQFSFMCDGKPERITDLASFETARYVAEVAYSEFLKADKKSASCSHSYHADYVKRERFAYFMGLVPEEKVGTHIFYCDQESDAVS